MTKPELWHPEIVDELPDLRELLLGAADSFRTVTVTIRNWRDDEKFHQAWERDIEEQDRRSDGGVGVFLVLVDDDADQGPEPPEEILRIWYERPDRVRMEAEGRWARTRVSDGRSTWTYSRNSGAVRQEGGLAGPAEGSSLLQPAYLLPGVDFDILERTEVVGRQALRVRARRRPGESTWGWHDLHGLAPGADEYDLVVDAERGVLLRAAALTGGEEFASSEVIEIAFDERIEPERFTFTPPSGETVRTPEETFAHLTRDVSTEDASRRAPFTVFIPTGLGPDWRMRIDFHEEVERPPTPATVFVNCLRDDDSPEEFALSERASRESDAVRGLDWERVDRAGQAFYVYLPSEQKRLWPSLIRFKREGTRIELDSPSLGRDRLLEIAVSLEPA